MKTRLLGFLLIFYALAVATPCRAQMVDPAIDRPGEPFSYFNKPADVLGVMDAPDGTLVTPEGYLYTGFGELMFFTGNPPEGINQRVKTLRKGYLPVVQFSFTREHFTYSFTMFAATLDGSSGGPLVNFVRIQIRNNGHKTATPFLSVATRYQSEVNSEDGLPDNRFERPVTAKHVGGQWQSGVVFNPAWIYGFLDDAFVRDGKVMYLFSAEPHLQRTLTLKDSYNEVRSIKERALSILPSTPVGVVQYHKILSPGEQQVLEFRMPYEPLPVNDPRLAALRSVGFDELLERTEKFWEDVFGRGIELSVPEAKVIDTFNASLVYDLIARNKIDGDYIQTVNKFQYHEFFLRDISYIARMYDLSGYSDYARQVLAFFARWQDQDGNFVSQAGQFDGWGQTLWAYGQHYRITRDRDFAASVYPSVRRAVEWLKTVRRSDSLGLIPTTTPGDNEDISGHITGHNFYGLAGLKNAIALAEGLDEASDAEDYRREYDDYKAALQRALSRITPQSSGSIPPGLDNLGGQDWGNMESVYPEMILDPFDPMVTATLNATRAKYREGIMTYGSGRWLHHYLTTMNTETELVREEQEKVLEEFYALLVHTSSTNAGFEFSVRPWGTRDFGCNLSPNGWFAAKFRILLRDMLVREQGNDLHLLSAVSPEWVRNGEQIRVLRAATDFGEVNYTINFSSQTTTDVRFDNHWTSQPGRILLHVPWFMKLHSAIADGSRLYTKEGVVSLLPSVHRLELNWERLPLSRQISFEQSVQDYKIEYRQRYDNFVSTGETSTNAP
jgi:hypothetical protein